jgi:hypothetical protein
MWQQRLQGVTLDGLLADLERLLAAPPVDAEAQNEIFQQLQWMVRFDAGAARELHTRLLTRQLGSEASDLVVGALGAAGTAPAQQVLAALRADPTVDTQLREATTISCVQLAAPVPELVAGLCDGAAAGELDGTSMLVLGVLAPRAAEQRIGDRSPLDVLRGLEAQAEARGELDTWVLAVGNTRGPEVLPIAQRLIDHPAPAVRGACCKAVRGVASADALTILIQRGLADADVGVRTETVLALGRRPEAAARAALEQVARTDPDASVRERAKRFVVQGS